MQAMAATLDYMLIYFSSLLFIWFIFSLSLPSLTKLRKKKSQQYPPSPPKLPIIGHLHLLSSGQAKSFQALATRYGPIIRLNLGASTTIIVSNSTIAKEMLKTNELNFVSRPDFSNPDFDIYKGFTFITADYGMYWRFMKKICMTQLLSSPQVNRFADIRKQEMMKLLDSIVKCSEGETECDIGLELMRMTNNMTCRMAMSTRCSKNGDESREIWAMAKGVFDTFPKFLLGEMLGPLGKFDLFGHGKKLKGLLMQFDRLVEGIIMEHEERGVNGNGDDHEIRESEDMMDILLKIYRDETAEVKLTRNHIKCFFLEIFLAGTETTSVALQWTIAELINHPDVFKKLREEINSVVGSTRLVNESDVPNLPYLQAVVKESLRLHPSSPIILRKSIEDCKINGYDILANDRIMINLYAIMRDPGLWEDPTAFVPDRFLVNLIDGHDDGTYQHHHLDVKGSNNFEYFPFGSGRRGCPGATLAWLVMQTVVAALVQCFDFKVNGGKKIDMDQGSGFSTGMAHPLVCYPIIHFNPPEINMATK